MELELNDDEALELKKALDIHLVGLRNELVHTDDRAYRRGERTTLDTLEHVQKRLSGLIDAGQAPVRKAG